MSRRIRMLPTALGVSLALCLAVAGLSAQSRGGGGVRTSGGGSTGTSQTRLVALTSTLKLDEAQKKQAKTILDDAFKNAAPVRTALIAAREKLGAAIQAGLDQTQIEQAMSAYAAQAAVMASAEAQAIAKILSGLTPEQQDSPVAVQTAASLMRGAFVGKKWDTTPDVRFY